MSKQITDEHVKLVKHLVEMKNGVLKVSEYTKYFMVSRPTALKRMKKIGQNSSLVCKTPRRGQKKQTLLKYKGF